MDLKGNIDTLHDPAYFRLNMADASGVALRDVKESNPGFHLKLAFKLIF